MPRKACIWTDFGGDAAASKWYEDSHIPDVVGKLGTTGKHAEKVEDKLFEHISGVRGENMTLFELPDGNEDIAQDLQSQIRPDPDELPKNALVNTRIYSELGVWHGKEWRGDEHDIRMWCIIRFTPDPTAHDDFLRICAEVFVPKNLLCPDVLRINIFKLDEGSLFKDKTYQKKDAKDSFFQYMTLWQFKSDELPEKMLVDMVGSDEWAQYDQDDLVHWQVGRYMVKKLYLEGDSKVSIPWQQNDHTNQTLNPSDSCNTGRPSSSGKSEDVVTV